MSLVTASAEGTVTVPDSVLVGIAVRAADSVDGIRVRRRRTIDLDASVVRLAVAARQGEPLIELAGRAQDEVATVLRVMCGIEARVDIRIGALE